MVKKFFLLISVLLASLYMQAQEQCGYAVFDSSTSTLTFKYGTPPSGDNVYLTDNEDWYYHHGWSKDLQQIKKVVFDPSFANARPASTYGWFGDTGSLQDSPIEEIVGLQYLNTSNVTNMGCMFYKCKSLNSLDVSHFDTSNVKNMGSMFLYCSGLTDLDVSNFDTSNVTEMYDMFSGCSSLTDLDVSNFDTSNVTSMSGMFYDCSSLTTIYVSDLWSTKSVTYGGEMFSGCWNLKGGEGTYVRFENTDYTYARIDGGDSSPGYLTKDTRCGYAEFDWSTETLTFFYGNPPSGDYVNNVYMTDNTFNPGWSVISNQIKKVVFDSSFAQARPISTADWFSNYNKNTSYFEVSPIEEIEGLQYLNTSKVKNMTRMFYMCEKLTYLDVSHFDTGNVRFMEQMFCDCIGLTSLDVSHFDTGDVTSMSYMFYGCSGLTDLDVSNFDTSNVTDMFEMFSDCSGLTSLDVSHFDTSKVTNMGWMFFNCKSLTSLDVSHFDTSSVMDMSGMFSHCESLTNLDVSHFNTAQVTDMSSMFALCNKLKNIDVSNFDTGSVIDMSDMFKMFDGSALTSLDVSHFDTSNVIDMSGMFYGCDALKNLDVSHFNTGNVTNMNGIFLGCSGLTSFDVTNFDTSKVTDMGWMFSYCSGLTCLDISNFDTSNVTVMGGMFYYCNGLTTIYVSDLWNNQSITSEYSMFTSCVELVGGKGTKWSSNHVDYYIDSNDYKYARIDGGANDPGYFTYKKGKDTRTRRGYAVFDSSTSTLTFMYGIPSSGDNVYLTDNTGWNPGWLEVKNQIHKVVFDQSYKNARPRSTKSWFLNLSLLTEIVGLQNLDTSNVTDMMDMFTDCSGLTSLDISHFKTSKVMSMIQLFYNCSGLTSLDISNFDTSNVKEMSNMFHGCSSLTSLDLNNFDTSKVTDMMGLFGGCTALTILDISNFDTHNVANMSYMFYGCECLKTIYTGNLWSTQSLINGPDMFNSCEKLIGGKGTKWSSDKTDYTYARIDGGTSAPGYFTDKAAGVIMAGDANGDGKVGQNDIELVSEFIMTGVEPDGFVFGNADVNGDNKINAVDIVEIVNIMKVAAQQ